MKEGEQFDWNALVPYVIHPLKVAIVEALVWIEQPLSAPDFRKLFNERFSTGVISYHLVELAKTGTLEMTKKQRGVGAPGKFYFLRPAK